MSLLLRLNLEKAKTSRDIIRPALFALLPIALVVGTFVYVTGGQIASTDNAYVAASTISVSTDVAGTVKSVEVVNNQPVKQGQVLYTLQSDSFRTSLAGAQAQLETVRTQVATIKASYKLSLAQIAQAQAELPFYQTAYDRQQALVKTGAASKAANDQAKHDLDVQQQKVLIAQAQAEAALAQLDGNPDQSLEDNAFYKQAKTAVENAQRDLEDTIVRAPFDGVVTNVNAIQVGSYLQAAQAAFSLVATSQMWVDASPKETEITDVRPGQNATITVDTYPGLVWHGKVDSISPASSSSFSLLPAQNTTGNWVKVVQRVPVRVLIDSTQDMPQLRVGMSATVNVDTQHPRGWPQFVLDLFGAHAKPTSGTAHG